MVVLYMCVCLDQLTHLALVHTTTWTVYGLGYYWPRILLQEAVCMNYWYPVITS